MKWTINKAHTEALKFETRYDFQKGSTGAYKWAYRNNHLDKICQHMKPKFQWDFEGVKKESKKYNTRHEFFLGSSSAYQWACRNKVIDQLLPQSLTHWDLDSVRDEAKKYSSREEFRVSAAGASQWAARNGYWEDVCAHMDHCNKPVTREEAKRAAESCLSRSEFYYNFPRCYAWALRNKCIDDICSHMTAGNTASDANVIYIWSPDGMSDVYKFGISSYRLADQRVKLVARAGGLSVEFCTIRKCDSARDIEKSLLRFGRPYEWPQSFDGSSEFRQLEPDEIDQMFSLVAQYKEASA